MNSSSTIEISKSSLLSLKAEVLRKQQEINKAKLQSKWHSSQTPLRQKVKNDVPDEEQNEPSNKGISERQLKDQIEDEDMLQKSRKMLEAKAKLYNRLVKGPEHLTEDEIEMNSRYLVQFDRKTRDEKKTESSDEEHFSDEYEPATNPDEEWVEYTDCLGRTRKCLRKDLEYLKEKDFEFSKTLDPEQKKKLNENKENTTKTTIDENITENNELLSSDMRRELLRKEWEKQEQELQNKNDIHYEDVLFNEARTHGVGYYAFSHDEDEREKQQEELRKLRKETVQQQKANLDQKALREKQLAARLKAARNRKRARMGLPPEEDEPEAPEKTPEVKETEKEEEPNENEKAREKARENHIRPWDIGKEGVKKHYEYSQEEWVDKKRTERLNEFAPPSSYQPENKRKKSVEVETVEEEEETDKSLYFTSKRKSNKKNKPFENFNAPSNSKTLNPYKSNTEYDLHKFKSTAIVNECIDFDDDEQKYQETDDYNDDHDEDEMEVRGKGVEIAPPSTFEYYGPSDVKMKKNVASSSQSLEDSIAAGLKYLRDQAEKKQQSSRKRDF